MNRTEDKGRWTQPPILLVSVTDPPDVLGVQHPVHIGGVRSVGEFC